MHARREYEEATVGAVKEKEGKVHSAMSRGMFRRLHALTPVNAVYLQQCCRWPENVQNNLKFSIWFFMTVKNDVVYRS